MDLQTFSLIKYPSAKPTLILSASDTPFSFAGSDTAESLVLDHGLDIYAEAVSLPRDLTASSRHVGIFAHSVALLPGKQTRVDVAGKDGVGGGTNLVSTAKDGEKGRNGGDVQFYLEQASSAILENLQLDASGGRGGNGESTAKAEIGGKGADGGGAGTIAIAVKTGRFSSDIGERAFAIIDADGEAPADMMKMYSAFLAACDHLVDMLSASEMDKMQALRRAINTAAASGAGPTKELHKAFRIEISTMLRGESLAFEAAMTTASRSRGGDYGAGGTGTKARGSNGASGKSTSPNIAYAFPCASALRELPMPIAHPDQCAMVLHLAKLEYFIGTAEKLKSACARLVSLRDRLLFLDGLQPSDPIFQAYKEAESRMYVGVRTAKTTTTAADRSEEPPSIAALREVAASVDLWLRQLASGVDFYGHSREWVPRGSHSFYDKLTQSMLAHADKTRALYSAFRAATATAEKAAAMSQMQQQAQGNAEAARDFVERLRPALSGQVTAILAQDEQMRGEKKALLALLEGAKDRIKYMDAELSKEEMVGIAKAFVMLAVAPSQGPKGIDAAKESLKTIGGTLYQAAKDPKILDDAGEPVRKEFVIEKITALQGGTAGLLQAYRASTNDDHTADLDDPGATKLIASKKEISELIGGFSRALSGKSVEDVKTAFDNYVSTTLQRNDLVLRYNATIALIQKKEQEACAFEQQSVELSSQVLKDATADLPSSTLFMEQCYAESLWILLESFSRTQRALRFLTLSPATEDVIGKTLRGNPTDFDALHTLRTKLLQAYADGIEAAGKNPQHFEGVRHYLTAGELGRLKGGKDSSSALDGGAVVVKIPPATRKTTADESPFHGMCNVRLKTVRFFARGAAVGDGVQIMTVFLTHLGEETIVDFADTQHVFVHDRIRLQFRYRVADMGYSGPGTVEGNIGEAVAGNGGGDDFALVGPFASWSIELSQRHNPGLSLQSVEEAWLEFGGTFRSF